MSSMECVDISTFIGREITTVLNKAVDNVIQQQQLNLIATFRKESCK